MSESMRWSLNLDDDLTLVAAPCTSGKDDLMFALKSFSRCDDSSRISLNPFHCRLKTPKYRSPVTILGYSCDIRITVLRFQLLL